MMIFNSFTVANNYNFGAQWPNDCGRRFLLPTNKILNSQVTFFKEKESNIWIQEEIAGSKF